jgi:hypothetical protein
MPPTLTLEAPADDDIVNPARPTFKIFSNALKAFEKDVDGTARKFLSCTASSTVEDLHGDRMTAECVQGMAPQAKSKGMNIFLNHSYKVPEDVFGKTVDSKIVARSGDGGAQIWDLDLEIMLNEANPRAIDTYAAIKDQGMKLGVSIGAMIEDYEFIDEEAGFWGGLEIKEVNLLEASIVGIPANQRSWVVNGLAALGAPKAIINKALGRTKETNPPKPAPEPPEPPAPAPEPVTADFKVKIGEQRIILDGKDITAEVEVQVIEKEITPNPDGSFTLKGDSDAPASPEAESQDGGDTSSDDDDEGTETQASATLEDAAAAVDALASAGADASMLEILLSFLEGATEEVASLRKTNADLTTELEQAQTDVQRAAEIVETIAKTPLGRKAGFSAPVSTFRSRYAGYYSEGLLKLLDGEDKDSE